MSEAVGSIRFQDFPIPTTADELAAGRDARKDLPRSAHAEYRPAPDRDPIGIIRDQNTARIQELVPLRLERMTANPFAFYRGTAALQAADLRNGARTGRLITICGDAHLSNFGLYASPQRTMVFDLNDFDEGAWGPWEWDLKRLVTSIVVAAQHKGLSKKDVRAAAVETAAAYRTGIYQFLQLGMVDRYYLRGDVAHAAAKRHHSSQAAIDRALKQTHKRTSARVVERITERDAHGHLRIVQAPPVLAHVPETTEAAVTEVVEQYRQTVAPDIAMLLANYRVVDVARRVVGVGSVGTRCYIAVMLGPSDEPLVIQVKQAAQSVVEQYGRVGRALSPVLGERAENPAPGFRVTASQRILQAVSDPFLGHVTMGDNHYYLRQFRDRNVGFEVDLLAKRPFMDYADACAVTLARAHAQSPSAAFIAGYLGKGDAFDRAVAHWSLAYAAQARDDFDALRESVNAGHFSAE